MYHSIKNGEKRHSQNVTSIDKDIEIIIDNQSATKFFLDSYVCSFHIYKEVWFLPIGEEILECSNEKENVKWPLS